LRNWSFISRVLSLVFNRREGWPPLQAVPAGMHKVAHATSGDYRTAMRLSQFCRWNPTAG